MDSGQFHFSKSDQTRSNDALQVCRAPGRNVRLALIRTNYINSGGQIVHNNVLYLQSGPQFLPIVLKSM